MDILINTELFFQFIPAKWNIKSLSHNSQILRNNVIGADKNRYSVTFGCDNPS